MQLAYLLLAEHAEVSSDGKTYANGLGLAGLALPMPGPCFFYAVGALDIELGETNQDLEFTVRFEDPDGGHLAEVQAHFQIGVGQDMPQGESIRFPMSLAVQAQLSVPGPHAIILEHGGVELGRTRLTVRDIPLPPVYGS